MDARAATIGVDRHYSTDLFSSVITSSTTTTTAASFWAATSSVLPTTTPSGAMRPSRQQQDEGECQLLGSFALLVQAALGALALLALVYKRWRERPQRPLKIWFFDASKQVFGSVLVHVANIFMSMLTSGRFSITATATVVNRGMAALADEPYVPNPCSFYLLNLGIDTTLGIPILIVLLRILTAIVALTPVGKPRESIQSGHYGDPPSAWWWLKQSVIYFCGLFLMKMCVLVIFIVMPWISKAGDWALGWTEGNEKLQIAFVMMIFPLIMNAMQYYIIDSFIKNSSSVDAEAGAAAAGATDSEDHEGGRRGQFFPLRGDDPLESDGDADDEGPLLVDKASAATATTRSRKLGQHSNAPADEEYDPDLDGAVHARVDDGGSSRRRGKVSTTPVTADLLPKE